MAELARPLLVYPLFRYGLPTAYHGTSGTHQPDDLSLQYTHAAPQWQRTLPVLRGWLTS